jgi:hypothetical protein
MTINTYQSVAEFIKSRLYAFDAERLSSGGDLEFLRDYIFSVENTDVIANKVTALQTLREAILALDDSDLTLSDIRNLIDTFHTTEIGAIEDVKLDGITSKSVASTIGISPTELVSGDNNLVDALNKLGDISFIRLDGVTNATNLAAVIGNGTLVTTVKTDLVSAINSVNTMSTNIIVSTGTPPDKTLYICGLNASPADKATPIAIATYVTDVPTNPTTSTTEILNGWIKCVTFAQRTSPQIDTKSTVTTTADGCTTDAADVITITSAGDALVKCLGTITDVTSYT